MKMAAARPQSVFTADVYLSDNSNRAPTLAFCSGCLCYGLDDVGDGAMKEKRSCYL